VEPSPCIAVFGEVLEEGWPDDPVPAGLPLRVARHLAAFGFRPLLITRVGHDEAARRLLAHLVRWGVDTQGVQRDATHPTGRGARASDLPEQPWDFVDAAQALRAFAERRPALLYFGTLAQRSPASRQALQRLVACSPGPRVFDVNLVEPWYEPRMLPACLLSTDVLVMNERELGLLSRLCGPVEGLAERMAALLNRFLLHRVVVRRGDGAWLQDASGADAFEPGTGSTRSAEGARDAFAAVLLAGMAAGWPSDVTLMRAAAFARATGGRLPEDQGFYSPFLREWQLAGREALVETLS